jgi:hypothetical protein
MSMDLIFMVYHKRNQFERTEYADESGRYW